MNQHQDFSVFDGYKEPNRDSESQDDYGMVDWDADWEKSTTSTSSRNKQRLLPIPGSDSRPSYVVNRASLESPQSSPQRAHKSTPSDPGPSHSSVYASTNPPQTPQKVRTYNPHISTSPFANFEVNFPIAQQPTTSSQPIASTSTLNLPSTASSSHSNHSIEPSPSPSISTSPIPVADNTMLIVPDELDFEIKEALGKVVSQEVGGFVQDDKDGEEGFPINPEYPMGGEEQEESQEEQGVAMVLRGGASSSVSYLAAILKDNLTFGREENNLGPGETYGIPPSFSVDTNGDLLVEIPNSSAGFAWIDPTYSPSYKLTSNYAATKPKEMLMFLCGPVDSSSSHDFTPEVHELRCKILALALVLKTRKAYGGSVLNFLRYCDSIDAPSEARLPSHPEIVINFLVSLHGKRVGMIKKYLSALTCWNGVHGFDLKVPPRQWDLVKKGLKTVEPDPLAKRRALPVDEVFLIVKALDDNDPGDVVIKAALCIAFQGMLRCGEFTVPSLDSFHPDTHPKPSDITFYPEPSDGSPPHLSFHLPWDKTNKKVGRDVNLIPINEFQDINPIAALSHHLKINNPPKNGFLFAYRASKGPRILRNLTKSFFVGRINFILRKAGKARISGHEIRVGGCNFWLTLGLEGDKVRMMGGWTSPVYLQYWRSFKDIAILELKKLGLLCGGRKSLPTEEELEEEDLGEE